VIDADCVRCHSEDTETELSTSYRGSAKLRLAISVSCNECEQERTYVDSFNYLRE